MDAHYCPIKYVLFYFLSFKHTTWILLYVNWIASETICCSTLYATVSAKPIAGI